MRFIVPIILIILSVASFVMFTNPAYQTIKALKVQAAQYDTALTNSKKLQEQRDALGTKYRSISPDSLARLQKLLPDNADNIRLIIDIQNMAQSYGMSLDAIKFDANQTTAVPSASPLAATNAASLAQSQQNYGVFNLEFSTTASYENFLKFLKDVESSLRLTDVQSVDFVAGTDPTKTTNIYTVKLATYWLKR